MTGMSPYAVAMRQLEHAAELMELNPDVRRIVARTSNEIVVRFPVRMDDGRIAVFTGYRIQHSNVLGPFSGGLRLHASADIEDVRAFAMRMTWKRAVLGIPFGGAMGVIQVDPRRCSEGELERIVRRFTFALGQNIGPEYDIPAPEMNANAQIMAWVLDSYLSTVPPQQRNLCRHVVTGKPLALGGCAGRDKAPAQGLVFLLEKWTEEKGLSLAKLTFTVQGFGRVGSWAARLLARAGGTLLAVEDSSGGVFNAGGIDPEELLGFARERGTVAGFPKAATIDHDEFLRVKADLFVPAALHNQINRHTAPLLDVKLVAEGANGPTDSEGEEILAERKIEVLPDLVCNAGGALVNYFEWLQNRRSETWEVGEVDARLHRMLVAAYERVRAIAAERGVDLRTAALVEALTRLEDVYLKRGIFP
ncbi:MAG: Glu/Leu/Phe/Val dehydrogenase [Planctomycetota bacterium]